MSSKAPKTGLSERMRAWMKDRPGPYTVSEMAVAIGVSPGKERERMRQALRDFMDRKEVVSLGPDRRLTKPVPRYVYNAGWRPAPKGDLRQRIYKAMYYEGRFAVTDIVRLAHRPDDPVSRSFVDKTVMRLKGKDLIRMDGRRTRKTSYGVESVWMIPNRDKFRLEVMV